ncbi:MAG: hypothetical protein WBR17_40790 [Paraburkholderia sp.]|uniref:hypothetical protein n=1 Tax=Paraburkholderia sp. TaxID=1926495 RepID=UPI003C4AB882
MELNVLVLPLIGGYRFYTKFNWTAYGAARCSNQRLIFDSSLIGLGFLVGARAFERLVAYVSIHASPSCRYVGGVACAIALLTCVAAIVLGIKAFWSEEAPDWKKATLGAGAAALVAAYFVILMSVLPGGILCNAAFVVALMAAMAIPVGIAARALHPGLFLSVESIVFRISILLLLSSMVSVAAIGYAPQIVHLWKSFSPYSESGAAALACAIGIISGTPLNRLLFRSEPAIRRLFLNLKMNAFEREMFESMLEEVQIQITLEDGKVYTGWAMNVLPNLAESDTYFRILPVWSGHRDEKLNIVQTTWYDDVYKHYVAQMEIGGNSINIESFIKVIPISKIIIAGKYNDEAAGKFIAKPAQEPSGPTGSDPLSDG